MSNELFLSAVKRITERTFSLSDLIGTAEALKAAGEQSLLGQVYHLWIQSNQQDPLLHVALFNYAVTLSDSGNLAGAKAALESCIAQNPDFYPAYINIGGVLERMGNAGEGINQWTALVNRLALITGGALNFKLTAMKQIGRVMETHRMFPGAENVLVQSLMIDQEQPDVVQHYVALRLAQCEWPIIVPWEGQNRKKLMRNVSPLSMAIYSDDPMLQLGAAWSYCKNYVGYPENDFKHKQHDGRSETKRRRRIGYVSSDLRNHAVGFIMAELFEVHNRDEFEIFAYYCGIPGDDALKDRVKATVDHWVDINGLNDEAAAQRIIDDGIDILVDVNGYTKDARNKMFALRPAPIIVNWLGFPGTMGSPYHHYIIADDWIIPKEHEKYFSEKVMRLPCYQPNDRKRVVAEHTPTRAEAGLPEDKFVFCSFNGVQKISRFTFDRWMEVLKGVPDSVLWLLDGSEEINARLRQHAADRGVDGNRLIFAGKKDNADHLARYPLADLFLDTLPYGAHVTASDALWMGVPILTLTGRGFAARVCGSLVRSAGLPEMVCSTPKEFVERAIALGKDKAAVTKLKAKLAKNRDTCVLFDTGLLVKHLEKSYNQMWQDFLKGNLPKPDMTNIEHYLTIGCAKDHDAVEVMLAEDYNEHYTQEMAKLHDYSPLRADDRLWTEADIAKAEKQTTKKTSTQKAA